MKKLYKKNKLPTSKKIIIGLFINCIIIELFTGYITLESIKLAHETFQSPDFTPLITLIGAIVGEVISFAIYCAKSVKENCEGGIIFEQAKQDNINIYDSSISIEENNNFLNNAKG